MPTVFKAHDESCNAFFWKNGGFLLFQMVYEHYYKFSEIYFQFNKSYFNQFSWHLFLAPRPLPPRSRPLRRTQFQRNTMQSED